MDDDDDDDDDIYNMRECGENGYIFCEREEVLLLLDRQGGALNRVLIWTVVWHTAICRRTCEPEGVFSTVWL